ncbi:hypothetical protein M5E86_16795 [Blautia wexlerae]|nr:hypothetical protein M5E86_16795 [Blautia wexlerae]
MKKKKLYLTAFLLVLALALQGGIFSGFSVPVQAAATSKKANRICEKNGSWYYYDKNGKKATGWYKSAAGNQYYFGKTGASQSRNSDHQWKKVLF